MTHTKRRNFLIVGSGGREHALASKIGQSQLAAEVYSAPGNGGTLRNLPISTVDMQTLARFAAGMNLVTIVGPEVPLTIGIADLFARNKLEIFGHTAAAAMLEGSKSFSKEFMERNHILTSRFEVFDAPEKAKKYVRSLDYAVVVKADGLASGKGVIVCDSTQDALDAIDKIMVARAFGSAGSKIVIEKRLYGTELSYIVITDGKAYIPMATSQDHKKLLDGDRGPNTGGMGAYSPAIMDAATEKLIRTEIVERTLEGMRREALPANGFIYFGLMIVGEGANKKIYLLEINMRSGDPETQAIIPRMKSDIVLYIFATIRGDLGEMPPIIWDSNSSATVVMASTGYGYQEGLRVGETITGLDPNDDKSIVFHSGTQRFGNDIVYTSGGRVLAVTALGENLHLAVENAYRRVSQIHWPSEYHRKDIGHQALKILRRT